VKELSTKTTDNRDLEYEKMKSEIESLERKIERLKKACGFETCPYCEQKIEFDLRIRINEVENKLNELKPSWELARSNETKRVSEIQKQINLEKTRFDELCKQYKPKLLPIAKKIYNKAKENMPISLPDLKSDIEKKIWNHFIEDLLFDDDESLIKDESLYFEIK